MTTPSSEIRSPYASWPDAHPPGLCRLSKLARSASQHTASSFEHKSLRGVFERHPEPAMLIGIADTLLHLPETFPAAYLKVYDPIITQCPRLSWALQHFDLADMLDSWSRSWTKQGFWSPWWGMAFLPQRSRTCRVSSMPVSCNAQLR